VAPGTGKGRHVVRNVLLVAVAVVVIFVGSAIAVGVNRGLHDNLQVPSWATSAGGGQGATSVTPGELIANPSAFSNVTVTFTGSIGGLLPTAASLQVGDSQDFGSVIVELPATTDLSSYSVGDVVQVEGLCTGPGIPVGEPVVVASTLTDQTSGASIGG
jgi:hypothetical protein